ncbi:MAG TPA: hypothetical protein VGL20_01240 [Candidatus Dormibacteraeota bacterium]|jgi:hypothetical protein
MGEFEAGAYIGDDRKLYCDGGAPDPLGRWIDQYGYVRIGGESDNNFEDGWYVDDTGLLHDMNDASRGVSVEVPANFWVQSHDAGTVDPNQPLWGDAGGGTDVHMSDTTVGQSATEKLARQRAVTDMVQQIPRTQAKDAGGGDLTWAGSEEMPQSGIMHGRTVGTEFQNEATQTTPFRAGTLRNAQPVGDQWTTAQGESDPTTVHQGVHEATVNDAGLLVGPDGQPLNGTLGFVVDPNDGSLYTFQQNEMWASLGTGWVNITGQPRTILEEALGNGRQIKAVHHSTALYGAPAAGAGTITVVNGTITNIDNESGHYKPEAEYIWQTLVWLEAQGMPVGEINVRIVATDRDAEKYLKAWKLEQARGNVTQVAAKDRMQDELQTNAKIARLVPGSLQQQHYQATGSCLALNVVGVPGSFYCTCDSDLDLPPTYAPILNAGPQPY